MKRIEIFIITVILSFTVTNGQFTKIGGGLTGGTGFYFNNETTGALADLNRSPFIGIFVTGIYKLNLPIQIAPAFTYFIPRTNRAAPAVGGMSARVRSLMFDLDGHWVFNSHEKFGLYALGGFDITFAAIKLSDSPSSGNDNAIGLNLGAGVYFKLVDQLDLYTEVKYIVSKYDQVMLKAGLLLNLQLQTGNKNP